MTAKTMSSYDIYKHRHMFSSWAAGRAASVKDCRFPVIAAFNIIEHLQLETRFKEPSQLPTANEFDDHHRRWRSKAIDFVKHDTSSGFKSASSINNFTHGIAAKIINIYLKSMFVCGGHHDHPSVAAIHPPIDSLLLEKLRRKHLRNPQNPWKKYDKIRWSKFTSEQYEDVISLIKQEMNGLPLWRIEEYWPVSKDNH
jgi:hypothetical protein